MSISNWQILSRCNRMSLPLLALLDLDGVSVAMIGPERAPVLFPPTVSLMGGSFGRLTVRP